MAQTYSYDEARRILPDARTRIAEVAVMAGELRSLALAIRDGEAPSGAVPDAKALEARIDEAMSWFTAQGIQVKGIAPALLDFPATAVRHGEPVEVLLCWREGEEELSAYHSPDSGYLGRRPIDELDEV